MIEGYGGPGWRDVHQGRGQLARSLLSYPPSDYELEYPPSKQQKQQAASKQQASSKQAATSVCPLEKMMKYKFKKSAQYKNWTCSRRTAPKQWNVALIESSGGAKIELFPGPVRLWTSWYDLILALLYREATKMTCGWPASCWTTGMCIKHKRNCDKSWYPSFISKWLMYMWVYIYISWYTYA